MLEILPDPFLKEIAAQPAAIRRAASALHDQLPALRRVPAVSNGRNLVFTGMGGSYDACYAPVTTLAAAGIPGVMVDSAELLYFRRPMLAARTLLVVVSQSGESAEVVRLIKELNRSEQRPFVVSVTNGLENTLARFANVALDTRAGLERGPSTITFAGALVVLGALAHVLSGKFADEVVLDVDANAEAAADAVDRFIAMAQDLSNNLRSWLGDRPILTILARGAARCG